MRKLKLFALKREENHNIFYIEKDKIFLKGFRDFLHEIGFKKQDTAMELLRLLGDMDNNYSSEKYSNKLYQDEYFYFENKSYKIDVFFGKEKIIVSLFTSIDRQEKIMELILKFCDFKEG